MKSQIMNTTHHREALSSSVPGAAVAADAVALLLLFGAGATAAHLQINPSPVICLGGVSVHAHG